MKIGTLLSVQNLVNEGIYIFTSDVYWNLVTIFRIDDCPRVTAMSIDRFSQPERLIGICSVVFGPVED